VHNAHPSDESEELFRQRQINFINADLQPGIRTNKERFVVIKEATANLGVSFILLLIVYIAGLIHPIVCTLASYILLAILCWSMLWYHAIHRERQRDFEQKSLGISKKEG